MWAINGTLLGNTTLGHSGIGSKDNKMILNTPQISRTGVSPSKAV